MFLNLTDDELLLLDGKVADASVQEKINHIKKRKVFDFPPHASTALVDAIASGYLGWRYDTTSQCKNHAVCGLVYGYAKYKRSSRYHRKGAEDRSKPFKYSGVKYRCGFINILGTADLCSECFALSHNKLIDYIIDNDLQIEIQKNDYRMSSWKKDEIKVCYSCKQDMFESEMGKLRTLMGDGWYAGICPHCKAESKLFGGAHETTQRFRMIKVEEKQGGSKALSSPKHIDRSP